ncbi:hypothetical protein GALL_405730 [mine drainage metagenome]|uniref:Uncharacterized protein n=1 Tax=mine drainage metagenome TaxID=410659 RepID=A0A1J5Q212_9ZZZZ
MQYVLNVLRRPSELFYLTSVAGLAAKMCHSEKRETALIEKTDYADEYRLSTSGRLLLSLVNMARDATYLRGDAYNLLHAIEFNDFPKILTFSDGIVAQLRNEILDVRSALERVGRTESVDKYLDRLGQYKKIVDETIDIARQAEARLESSETLDAFEQWQERDGLDITFEHLRHQINRVRQVLLIFNRLLSELVSLSLQSTRSAVPAPSFLAAAIHFVRSPLKSEQEAFLLEQWGATSLATPFHSVLDGLGAVKLRTKAEAVPPLTFTDEAVEPVSQLGKARFLERHGEDIAEALAKGPLRLSEAIEKGWFLVDAEMMLGDLVGIFVAPGSIPVEGRIEIGVSPSLDTKSVGQDDFLFTDIEITTVEAV